MVSSVAAVERVRVDAAPQPVIARAAAHRVVAGPTVELVVAAAAVERVSARAAPQAVALGVAVERVGAVAGTRDYREICVLGVIWWPATKRGVQARSSAGDADAMCLLSPRVFVGAPRALSGEIVGAADGSVGQVRGEEGHSVLKTQWPSPSDC